MFVSRASAFLLNGTVYDVNGIPLNNTLINITLYEQNGGGQFMFGSNSTTSNETGWYNLSLPENVSWSYKPVVTHTNSTSGVVDYVGKVLPTIPYFEFSRLSGLNFYLKDAGTINITAINETGDIMYFGYTVKDTKLGYEVSTNTNTSNELVYVPKDRNYSIMIFPAAGAMGNLFVPVSFSWNNFSATSDYTFGLSNYNATKRMLNKQFNVTESFAYISGYISDPTLNGWDNFTIVPFVMQPSNMIFTDHGMVPFNLSAWRTDGSGDRTDSYNYSTGFYNISLPYYAGETVRYILFAAGMNNTEYRGSYRDITVTGDVDNFNFTMYGMLGSAADITMFDSAGGWNFHNVSTKKLTFSLVNSTEILSDIRAHTETKLDYSNYNCTEFTFMGDISAGTGTFSLPLLNVTGIKEINIYTSDYAPKRVSTKTVAQLINNTNITMAAFRPGGDGIPGKSAIANTSIMIDLYRSNSTCDVPNPPTGCRLTDQKSLNNFNPMPSIIGGGEVSFRMGSGGVMVHYVDVDLMASGPPDALFEDNSGINSTDATFSGALKFGSGGPTIYQYVLISIPYSDTVGSGLDDSLDINMSVPAFYDDDWNVIWNTTTNGTSAIAFSGNQSHYSTYQSDWGTLMGSNLCTKGTISNSLQINTSNPCYVDTVNNRIWIRLPHFSGTEPTVSGTTATLPTTTTTTPSVSGGGGGGGVSNKNTTTTSTTIITTSSIGVTTTVTSVATTTIPVEKEGIIPTLPEVLPSFSTGLIIVVVIIIIVLSIAFFWLRKKR
jgi:hypothetical protein